jgi:hypothetical protein
MMANNNQHNSSPKSTLSVIGVWLNEMVQMSRTPLFAFSKVVLCFNSNSKA